MAASPIWERNLETRTKEEIRNQMLRMRAELALSDWEEKTGAIARLVIGQEAFRGARDVLCYLDVRGEAGTKGILEAALTAGKRVWAPRVTGRRMEFYRLRSLDAVRPGVYGIPEPESQEMAELEEGLAIVPGVAFDGRGNRLGYGGGYYDRFLTAHPAFTSIGICFGFQMVQSLPAEETDRPVQCLITESGAHWFGDRQHQKQE